LNGWTVYLDDNNNSVLDAGEYAFPTTNDGIHEGAFWFTKQQATPGTYTVRAVRPADVTSKFPSGPGFLHLVTVSANQSIIGAFGHPSRQRTEPFKDSNGTTWTGTEFGTVMKKGERVFECTWT
jgi:hypothetical protein